MKRAFKKRKLEAAFGLSCILFLAGFLIAIILASVSFNDITWGLAGLFASLFSAVFIAWIMERRNNIEAEKRRRKIRAFILHKPLQAIKEELAGEGSAERLQVVFNLLMNAIFEHNSFGDEVFSEHEFRLTEKVCEAFKTGGAGEAMEDFCKHFRVKASDGTLLDY